MRRFSSQGGGFTPIKIAICDDTTEDIELLSGTLYAYDNSFEIITNTSGETMIDESMDSNLSVDILFWTSIYWEQMAY